MACAIFFAGFLNKRFPTVDQFLPPHVLFSLGFMMLAAGLSVWSPRVLVNAVICRLGIVSYSAYIWHFAVLGILTAIGAPSAFIFGGPVWPYFIVYAAFVTAITAGLSEITYRAIETPMNEVGRGIARKLSGRSLSAGAKGNENVRPGVPEPS